MRSTRTSIAARRGNCIHFEPLGSSDAERLSGLQRRLFPPELREPVDTIRKILRNTEEHLVCNLSCGLFDGRKMVGYMFAYVEDRSLYHDRDEDVVYIKEIGLLPGYERFLRPLFFKLFEQWLAFCPGIPLEAHALDDALAKWQRLRRAFEFFGLTMDHVKEQRVEGRPPYNLLRLDVADYASALYSKPVPLPPPATTDRPSVTVVTDPRQWLSLQGPWGELLDNTPDSNVMQTFDFLWQWWRHHGIWNDLYIVVIRRGEEILGVVPMMREYFSVFGRVVRKLLFLTAPMEMSRPKLIFGRNDDLCWPAFVQHLEDKRGDWDIIDIDEQLPGERTDFFRDAVRRNRWLIADSETLCPYIPLDGDWDRFLAGLSRKMRGNINRSRRRLEEEGAVSVRLVNSPPAVEAGIDTHCEIEAQSWKADKSLTIGSRRESYFYYQGLAREFAAGGQFEQRILECGEKPVASTFGIAYNGVFQSLKIAHDSAFDRFSPGTVLESYELEAMFGSDLVCYEFMGSFLTNKLRWTSAVHRTINIHVYRRQPRLMLFYFVYFILTRRVVKVLRALGLFERVSGFLMKFRSNPFPRY